MIKVSAFGIFTKVVLCTFTKVYVYYIMSCQLENGVKQNGGSVPFLKERSFREAQKGGKSKKAKSKKAKGKRKKILNKSNGSNLLKE